MLPSALFLEFQKTPPFTLNTAVVDFHLKGEFANVQHKAIIDHANKAYVYIPFETFSNQLFWELH